MFSFRRKTRPDRHQFEAEALPHLDSLYNSALYMTKNDRDAEDLVQETMLKAFRFYDKYEKGTNIRAWLFKILKNAFINEYRRKKRQPVQVDYEEIRKVHEKEDPGTPDAYFDLREEMFNYLIGDEVTQAINAMPVDFRTVILLCDVEDFTYEEIAIILDIPIGTVRSRLHRARNLLKEKLKDYARSLGYEDKRRKMTKEDSSSSDE